MIGMFVSTAEAGAIRADSGFGCDTTQIVATAPRSGQESVPVDARLAFAVEGDCSPPDGYTVYLTVDDVVIERWTPAWGDQTDAGVYTLTSTTGLEEDTAYALSLEEVNGLGQLVEFGFTTGDGAVAGLTGAPVVTLHEAEFDADTSGILVSYAITPATDPDLLSMLVLNMTGAATLTHVLMPVGPQERRETVLGEAGELCIAVSEIDGLGVEVAGNTDCVTVAGSACGCRVTTPAAAGWALVLIALVGSRRRSVQQVPT